MAWDTQRAVNIEVCIWDLETYMTPVTVYYAAETRTKAIRMKDVLKTTEMKTHCYRGLIVW